MQWVMAFPNKLHSGTERFAGSPRDEGNRRKRKRKEAWGEERESCTAKKRSKRGKVPGDGAVKRRRRVQQVRKPRCVAGPAAHLS